MLYNHHKIPAFTQLIYVILIFGSITTPQVRTTQFELSTQILIYTKSKNN